MYSFLPGNVKQNLAFPLSSVGLLDSFISSLSHSVSVRKKLSSKILPIL